MPNAISVIKRTVGERIGWNRIGFAISVVILVVACAALLRLLRDIEIDKVVNALRATSLETVLTAGIFVICGYITLTFYDLFSLRTIGWNSVPYRIAAFASFTSYTIGHNLGATVFTGGAVRFRIYSAWGLGLIDVAKIAFITGLTFWLGNAFVLGVGMAYAPEVASTLNQFPPWLNRTIALVGLAVIAGYLIWLLPQPRAVGRDNWQVTLPNAPLTLVQIGIGVLDLGAGALAMYTLLPAHPAVDFTTVFIIFVTATLLGFLSHTPGSLGVFDAAMLLGLPEYEKEQLVASLLIFRVLYFVLPLGLAVLALGVREVWIALRSRGRVE